MTRNVKDAVLTLNDYAMERLTSRLEGLSDEELHWSPAPGSWDIRQTGSGRWEIDGDGGGPPWSGGGPPPLTTIAWRVGHLALSYIGFGGQLFRDVDLPVSDTDFPGAAAELVPWLETTYRTAWRDPLAARDEAAWWQPIGRRFGPYADDSVTDLALHIVDEVVHHGAEAALMRDLFARRHELSAG
jgi:DinB family protein